MKTWAGSLALAASLCIVVISCHSKETASSTTQEQSATDQSSIQSKRSSTAKEDSPSWNVLCSVEGSEFKIGFRSQTGDATNDDMATTVEWSDGTVAPIHLKPGWFKPDVEITSDIPNVCKGIVGHALPNHQVLLWVTRNDRPNPDKLALLLLDTTAKRVLDIRHDVGAFAEPRMIVSRPQGCSILILQDWRQSTNGGEFGIPEWMHISVRSDRISCTLAK